MRERSRGKYGSVSLNERVKEFITKLRIERVYRIFLHRSLATVGPELRNLVQASYAGLQSDYQSKASD